MRQRKTLHLAWDLSASATALHESSPLGRTFRDIHAATQHLAVTPTYYEVGCRVLFGLSPGTARF
jgi:hypothetical protein